MFDRILIANRGEIACRVIRTARRMGLGTVAVHSDVDAGAQHVLQADEAVSLGGSTPAESYLRGDAIIEAALRSGAGAIHPGYGFLSENPDFVEAVSAAGLVFIGPPAAAIRAMGLKDAAKALMAEAGVPVVPGYHGRDQDPARLAAEADMIGYPVLIKAVAGGGGKGMRRVEAADDFAAALAAARSEARGAFGNDDVLIEKYVTAPRHVEIQVFGDGKDAVYLFERDCSLQRRHQKVIEEAPAPGMSEEMRAAMGDAAVRAARAIGYSGAGTIEFIADGSDGLRPDRFWFMEMNTRLQVEHPVTEAVTGVDLVEWQLRVAAGEGLPLKQEELSLHGHAFEARLYAEDVPAGFLPATGRLSHLAFPQEARADSGVVAGDRISPFYDPMIAKLIVSGADRDDALARLEAALARTEVAGLTTNLDFLRALTRDPDFAAERVDTGLIDRKLAELIRVAEPPAHVVALAALAAAGFGAQEQAEAEPADLRGFTLWRPLRRRQVLEHREERITLTLEVSPDAVKVDSAGADGVVLTRRAGAWFADGRRLSETVVRAGDEVIVMGAALWRFTVPDPLAQGMGPGHGSNVVEAPMPGLVKGVMVETDQRVEAGEAIAVLEAMKMEHTLKAPRDGAVAEVLAAEGDQVEAGAALIRLHPAEDAGGAGVEKGGCG